jgi:hypothetical protein
MADIFISYAATLVADRRALAVDLIEPWIDKVSP